jgi:N-acetylmuramoyl-L-alanine amidase
VILGLCALLGGSVLAKEGRTGCTIAKPERPLRLTHVRRVVIDPGHGGTNNGAVAVTGAREKTVTLGIAQALAARLKARTNVEPVLTRQGDEELGLRQRTRMANAAKGDVFISIHGNSSTDPTLHGVEVYFLSAEAADAETGVLIDREEGVPDHAGKSDVPWSLEGVLTDMDFAWVQGLSERLASHLATSLATHLVPKAKLRGVRQAPFGVLKEARMPSVVLEVGYLTHPDEGRALLEPERHAQIARAVILALAAFDKDLARARPPKRGASPRHARR